jgi:hypothetical protein
VEVYDEEKGNEEGSENSRDGGCETRLISESARTEERKGRLTICSTAKHRVSYD